MKKTNLIAAAVAASLVALGACTTADPNVYSSYDAQRMSTVIDATVIGVRPVVIDGQQSGVGAAAGTFVGSVAGSSVGGYRDSFVGGIVGAVIGGVIGNATERAATHQDGIELTLQLRNGDRRAVVQARDNENFAIGDPVIIVVTGNRVRVTKSPVTVVPASR
ncbi:MAG: glycine zipper 2TM domain-containing protein [Burkholderiales bacterium]|nr:glycine zipper 2TM domain-containing protein [Burkholderiales bacterium]